MLANNTILNGGVVFGAAFDDKWKVRHISVESKKNLNKLAFSKYLQSDTEDTFSEAKELLESLEKEKPVQKKEGILEIIVDD